MIIAGSLIEVRAKASAITAHGRGTSWQQFLAAASAVTTLTACTSGTPNATPTGNPSASSVRAATLSGGAASSAGRLRTQPPAQLAGSAAVSAYLAMWADFATAAHASDWRSPLLSQHATAYALEVMKRSLYIDRQHGVITKGQAVDHPRVTSMSPPSDPTVVMISDCGDSSGTRKDQAKTGVPIPGSPGGRQAITAEVREQPDGVWKVDQFAVEGVGTC